MGLLEPSWKARSWDNKARSHQLPVNATETSIRHLQRVALVLYTLKTRDDCGAYAGLHAKHHVEPFRVGNRREEVRKEWT